MADAPGGVRTRTGRRARLLWAWAPVALWIGAILSFSSPAFATDQTAGFFERLLSWLVPGIDPAVVRGLNFLARRFAHLFEYGLLALLAVRAFALSFPTRPASRQGALAMGLVLAVAVVDESHQALVPMRQGSVLDVAFDCLGGGLALLGLALLLGLRRRRGAPDAARALPGSETS